MSVVVPAYNCALTIGQTIASVLLQTFGDWEMVIVDDGSTDETVEVAASYRDERILILEQENRGPASARNAGIAHSTGALVSTLDGDDLWLPRYLELMTDALADHRFATVAYTDAWVVDDESRRIRKSSEMAYMAAPDPLPATSREFLAELLSRNFVYNSVTVEREALEEVGGYDERLRTSEDWELWLRLAERGRRFLRIPGILAVHRNHARSLSADAGRMRASQSEVFRIIQRDWTTDDEVRELAERARRRREQPRAFDVLPSPMIDAARSCRRAIRRRTAWYRHAPHEVAALLAAVQAAPPAVQGSGTGRSGLGRAGAAAAASAIHPAEPG